MAFDVVKIGDKKLYGKADRVIKTRAARPCAASATSWCSSPITSTTSAISSRGVGGGRF